MDVPFHSSGAISRAHYAIVRKVETDSTQTADQHIFLEIKSLKDKFAYPNISTDKCKEYLLILLYCTSSVTPGFLVKKTFEFAFPHAINLVEVGKTVEDKRIGYLFCSELLPKDHELRLMLVNTIRKDLESDELPRICLALDSLITSPNEIVVPAVQARLQELLSHDNALVRRRALFAFRSLSEYEPALLDRIWPTIIGLLEDSDDSVVKAALSLIRDNPSQDEKIRLKGKSEANEILATESSLVDISNIGLIIEALKTIQSLGLVEASIPILFNLLRNQSDNMAKNPMSKALILGIFKTLSILDSNTFAAGEDSSGISAVGAVRHFLSSTSMNDLYLFLSCLESVDLVNWAGTSSSRPPTLRAEDFERIMQMLNIPDQTIYRKTMKLIKAVDPSLLDMHMSVITESLLKNPADSRTITVLLDLILIRHIEDGSKYAGGVLELIKSVDKATPKPRVSKQIVENVLTDLRASTEDHFVTSSVARFAQALIEDDVLGATSVVIATALITEYFQTLSAPPSQVLSGLATRLGTCAAIVQEPCVLAMIRVSAHCDEIPSEVRTVIHDISQSGSQVVRNRCAQFIEYSKKKGELLQIINRSSSPSLPDFLQALLEYHRPSLSQSPTRSRSPRPSSELRYAAYAPPQVGPRLTRRASSSQASMSSHLSHLGSPSMTAGQLALTSRLEDIRLGVDPGPAFQSEVPSLIDLQASRTDLISLESPFQMESAEAVSEFGPDFIDIWTSFEGLCDLRGWYNNSIDAATRRLQQFDETHHLRVVASDVPPFEGEVKVLMVTEETSGDLLRANAIALRLRESEEDSCLWRLRCADAILGAKVQVMFNT